VEVCGRRSALGGVDVMMLFIERFRAKWNPVRVKKTRRIKKLESFTVSVKW
jgi:hypothetical protein